MRKARGARIGRVGVLALGVTVALSSLIVCGCGSKSGPRGPSAYAPAQRDAAAAAGLPVEDSVDFGEARLTIVLIPPGRFLMGSPESEPDRQVIESPQHEVTVSKPFYLGQTEITQAQWKAVMGTEPWALTEGQGRGGAYPAWAITWTEAEAFCKAASAKTGRSVRLPTEAEWEYACRAGTTTRYYFGDDPGLLGDYEWYYESKRSSRDRLAPEPVGRKKPNPWGLHDMTGNISEWCADWFIAPYDGVANQIDPTGPPEGEARVIRSGYYSMDKTGYLRSASRDRGKPDTRILSTGLRVAVDAGPSTVSVRPAVPKGPTRRHAARQFNATVPLRVYVRLNPRDEAVNMIGSTPHWVPLEVPACDLWWVVIGGRDLQGAAAVVRKENVPGMVLPGWVTDADLAQVADLTGLERLGLGYTKITDAGLVHLKQLTALRDLELDNTGITDAGLARLSPLVALERLALDSCEGITDAGMAHVGQLKTLKDLALRSTPITAAGLRRLQALPGLQALDLGSTRVTGDDVALLKAFTDLRRLDLGFCEGITGASLTPLAGLKTLEAIRLNDTGVTDDGLEHLSGHMALRDLDLSSTAVGDAGFKHVAGATSMEVLALTQTHVTDAGIAHLRGMAALRKLALSGCEGVTDAGLVHLKAMSRLKTLDLDRTGVTDAGLDHLTGLRTLARLDLSKTKVTEAGAARLRKALPLTTISR